MGAKNKDHTRRPRGGAPSINALTIMLPPAAARMLRAVTQLPSSGPKRPGLRLRHKHGGKHDLYDSPGTAGVVRAGLVRCQLAMSARAVCAEMRSPTNKNAESGV